MTMPNVLKETCDGTACIPLQDVLFQRREIYCTGEIDSDAANALILQLRCLQTEGPGDITMYINSPGGEVNSGLAVYDAMRAVSCPVRTVCIGLAASMAAILFAAGAKRDILPHGRVVIHDPRLYGNLSGSALTVYSAAQELMQTRKTAAAILAQHTGHSPEEVLERTATDSFFNAAEAVAWGLADRIITQF